MTVLLEDYRELAGTYDKLVSIEMIEAVGWRNFDRFFARCSELLAPDGPMLLQAITIDDRAYEVEKAARPSSDVHLPRRLPAVGRGDGALRRRAPTCASVALEDITPHYVTTLRRWRDELRGRAPSSSTSAATTSASGACGSCTCATARPASPSGGSGSCRSCWPSRWPGSRRRRRAEPARRGRG